MEPNVSQRQVSLILVIFLLVVSGALIYREYTRSDEFTLERETIVKRYTERLDSVKNLQHLAENETMAALIAHQRDRDLWSGIESTNNNLRREINNLKRTPAPKLSIPALDSAWIRLYPDSLRPR